MYSQILMFYALQPLAFREALGATMYVLGVTFYDAFVAPIGYFIGAVGLAVGFVLFIRSRIRIEGPALRIKFLLECTKEEAQTINAYLNEVGISWNKYRTWVVTCMGKLMPLLSFRQTPYDDQLVATWGESKRAMLTLSLEKKLDPAWSIMDAVGAASAEIIRARMARGSKDIFNPTHEVEE